jgi:hypothetical protein
LEFSHNPLGVPEFARQFPNARHIRWTGLLRPCAMPFPGKASLLITSALLGLLGRLASHSGGDGRGVVDRSLGGGVTGRRAERRGVVSDGGCVWWCLWLFNHSGGYRRLRRNDVRAHTKSFLATTMLAIVATVPSVTASMGTQCPRWIAKVQATP